MAREHVYALVTFFSILIVALWAGDKDNHRQTVTFLRTDLSKILDPYEKRYFECLKILPRKHECEDLSAEHDGIKSAVTSDIKDRVPENLPVKVKILEMSAVPTAEKFDLRLEVTQNCVLWRIVRAEDCTHILFREAQRPAETLRIHSAILVNGYIGQRVVTRVIQIASESSTRPILRVETPSSWRITADGVLTGRITAREEKIMVSVQSGQRREERPITVIGKPVTVMESQRITIDRERSDDLEIPLRMVSFNREFPIRCLQDKPGLRCDPDLPILHIERRFNHSPYRFPVIIPGPDKQETTVEIEIGIRP